MSPLRSLGMYVCVRVCVGGGGGLECPRSERFSTNSEIISF